MNLQEFKSQHKDFTILPTKKLFFNKHPIKLKVRWDGCTFLNGTANRYGSRKIPDWVKTKPSKVFNTISKIKLRGRMIEINTEAFHDMYTFLQKYPTVSSRFEDGYHRGFMHLYFDTFDESSFYIKKLLSYVDQFDIEIHAPFQELSTGQIVTNPKVTKAGYKYRVNFKSFRLDLAERDRYARLLGNLGDSIKIPNSFNHILYDDWRPNRTVCYLSNKYVYTKDQSTMTYLTLALPNMIHSVQDLVSKKEISWQK